MTNKKKSCIGCNHYNNYENKPSGCYQCATCKRWKGKRIEKKDCLPNYEEKDNYDNSPINLSWFEEEYMEN